MKILIFMIWMIGSTNGQNNGFNLSTNLQQLRLISRIANGISLHQRVFTMTTDQLISDLIGVDPLKLAEIDKDQVKVVAENLNKLDQIPRDEANEDRLWDLGWMAEEAKFSPETSLDLSKKDLYLKAVNSIINMKDQWRKVKTFAETLDLSLDLYPCFDISRSTVLRDINATFPHLQSVDNIQHLYPTGPSDWSKVKSKLEQLEYTRNLSRVLPALQVSSARPPRPLEHKDLKSRWIKNVVKGQAHRLEKALASLEKVSWQVSSLLGLPAIQNLPRFNSNAQILLGLNSLTPLISNIGKIQVDLTFTKHEGLHRHFIDVLLDMEKLADMIDALQKAMEFWDSKRFFGNQDQITSHPPDLKILTTESIDSVAERIIKYFPSFEQFTGEMPKFLKIVASLKKINGIEMVSPALKAFKFLRIRDALDIDLIRIQDAMKNLEQEILAVRGITDEFSGLPDISKHSKILDETVDWLGYLLETNLTELGASSELQQKISDFRKQEPDPWDEEVDDLASLRLTISKDQMHFGTEHLLDMELVSVEKSTKSQDIDIKSPKLQKNAENQEEKLKKAKEILAKHQVLTKMALRRTNKKSKKLHKSTDQ